MILKHRSPVIIPSVADIQDPQVKKYAEGISRLLNDAFKNIYDDLKRLLPERVSDLPEASFETYQRFFIKYAEGAEDVLYLCIYNGSSYVWRRVTLTDDDVTVSLSPLTLDAAINDLEVVIT